jgi:APA family basic amino acid/polyamine antiporter
MATNGELPRRLGAVHPRYKVPHRADGAIGALVAVVVAVTDVRHAIGFSSFCVLTYYAIANAAAWTLPPEARRRPRGLAAAGVVGCVTLACTLPARVALSGGGVLAAGALVWVARATTRRPSGPGAPARG